MKLNHTPSNSLYDTPTNFPTILSINHQPQPQPQPPSTYPSIGKREGKAMFHFEGTYMKLNHTPSHTLYDTPSNFPTTLSINHQPSTITHNHLTYQ